MNLDGIKLRIAFISLGLLLVTNSASATYNLSSLHGALEPALILEKQEVIISLDQISTTYTLYNSTPQEIAQTFILPIAMQVTVNGHEIPIQPSLRAISNQGQDISKQLKSLGIPFDPITAMQSIDSSPNRESIRNQLISLKLLDQGEEIPRWTLKSHYFWRQQFAAQEKTVITQAYKPTITDKTLKLKANSGLIHAPGNAIKKLYNLTVNWSLQDQINAKNLQTMLEKANPEIVKYCPNLQDYQIVLNNDKPTLITSSTLEAKELSFPYLFDEIVCTSANKFSLKIQVPENMHAMLCWNDEFKRTSKGSLSFDAEHYVPLQNVSVLFLSKFSM